MNGEFGHRNIMSEKFIPPTPEFEAPWGSGERPLTREERELYGGERVVEPQQLVESMLRTAVGHAETYDVEAFIADINRG